MLLLSNTVLKDMTYPKKFISSKHQSSTTHPLSALLNDCRCLMKWLKVDRISHIYQEANRCADALAKLGCNSLDRIIMYDVPPTCIEPLLEADVVGTLVPRLCLI